MSRIAPFGQVRQRDPRIRDKAYLGFVATLPCIACAVRGRLLKPVEGAHVKVGYPEAGWRAFGHSERAHDRRTVPICAYHHRLGRGAQHQNNGGDERAWWDAMGIYPAALCEALVAAYEAGENGDNVVRRAAAGEFRLAHRGENSVE